MPIRATSHIAIGVRDMERSVGFYRDLLGLHVSRDQEEDVYSMDGGKAGKRRAVYLRWREGAQETFLVLDQQLSRDPFGEPARLWQVGVHHFGFWVDDIEVMHKRMLAAGVPVLVPPMVGPSELYGEPPGRKLMSAFYRDPDANVVQLDQRLPD
jgi:catechol 2,3-dioxygenase-like lactoylglutathione lyase family enzyme